MVVISFQILRNSSFAIMPLGKEQQTTLRDALCSGRRMASDQYQVLRAVLDLAVLLPGIGLLKLYLVDGLS
jgi:hypothetical protein